MAEISRIGQSANGKGSAVPVDLVYSFESSFKNALPTEDNAKEEEKGGIVATQAGFYYEAHLIKSIEKGLIKLGGTKTSEITDGSQKYAIAFFDSPEGIGYKETNLKRTIQNTAAKQAAVFCKEFEKDIEEAVKKNQIVKVGALEKLNGTTYANPLGDLYVKIGKKRIIIEAKWQHSSYAPTRWFEIADDNLFRDYQYSTYLRTKTPQKTWNYKKRGSEWINLVKTTWLLDFLKLRSGSDTEYGIFKYLLHKADFQAQYKHSKADAKIVMHGNYAGMTITNIEELTSQISDQQAGTFGQQQRYIGKDKATGSNSPGWQNDGKGQKLVFNGPSLSPLAWFGVSKYNTKVAGQVAAKNRVSKDQAYKFAFSMYIHQKMLSAFSKE